MLVDDGSIDGFPLVHRRANSQVSTNSRVIVNVAELVVKCISVHLLALTGCLDGFIYNWFHRLSLDGACRLLRGWKIL